MNPFLEHQALLTRRQFFGRSALGLGTAALASLQNRDAFGADPLRVPSSALRVSGGLPDLPHFAPKAKRVIYLFQNGAPSHVDLFDYKPKLKEWHGKQIPDEVVGGRRFSTMTGNPQGKLMLAPVEPFAQHGKSGAWVSKFMPHTAGIADELCFIKSIHTESVNHAPAIPFFLTKNLDDILRDVESPQHQLRRSLGAFDVVMLIIRVLVIKLDRIPPV